jgi:PAS domain S-box-containing protein
MAVRLRVILTVFLMTGAMVVASIFIAFWFGNLVLDAHAREQVRRDGITRLEELESVVKDAETGQRGFIITGDESYLQPFSQASERLPKDVEELRRFPWIDISPDEIGRITQLIEQKMAELRSTIELRRSGGFDAVAAVIRDGAGKQLMDKLRAELGQLKERQVSGLKADAIRSDKATFTRTLVFLFSGILNIAILAWGYRRIAEAIKQRDVALREAGMRGFELQQQKDLLSVTLSSIGDCVIVADEEARITFLNPVAEEVTGWKLDEALGRPTSEVFRILNEQTREPVESPVDKVMRQGVIVGLANHTVLIRKDGSEIPIDDSGAPIRDGKGGIRGVVLVFRDFSEHKQAERELRVAKDAAETANKAKDQFLAMLSHELRTPLTPVLATLNLWEASEEVPQSLQSDVQMLRRSIELEARIIDDLLDLTRIARGMLSFSPENTDVHSLVEFLVGLSQSEFQNKELRVTLQLEARRHHVHTDAARLQQVVWNILRNAIKFTEQGGAVTIATSNDAQNDIVIAISDSGIGMTPETLSKLFVPFEQADPTRNRRYGGLGLGMAISNALVELLEGHLQAESAGLGKGSTFTVRFPTTDPTAQNSETEHAPRTSRDKMRLLLVEDHVDTARALARLLENRGYKIETVLSVAAGLEAVERGQFDLLLCDLGLPDGTGIDFIEKVRENRKTPAIALTGFGMQEDVERAQHAGFDAHLTKPVNLQKLETTMWRLLKGQE